MPGQKNSKEHGIGKYHDLDPASDVGEQLKTVYSNWADSYDDDNDNKLKTVSQPNTVAMMMRHCLNRDIHILDVGCGTGLVGEHLAANGFSYFDGTDPSSEMMEYAVKRGYRTLVKLVAGEPLPFPENCYDATLCVGVFTHGHLGPEGFDELIRVTKPGGLICFTVNEGVWESQRFASSFDRISQSGTWEVLEMSLQDYMINEGVSAWYITTRVMR